MRVNSNRDSGQNIHECLAHLNAALDNFLIICTWTIDKVYLYLVWANSN